MNEKSIPFTDCPPFLELNLKITLKPSLKRSILLNNVFTEGELHNKMIMREPHFPLLCVALLQFSYSKSALPGTVTPYYCDRALQWPFKASKKTKERLFHSVLSSVSAISSPARSLSLFNLCSYCRSLCGLLRFLKRRQSHFFSTLMLSQGCLRFCLSQVQG